MRFNLAEASKSDVIKKGVRYLAWFVLVGWEIYIQLDTCVCQEDG